MPQWDVLSFDMGIHGWIALGLAVVIGVGLHLALMWLVRKRHDDSFRVGQAAADGSPDRRHPSELPTLEKDQLL